MSSFTDERKPGGVEVFRYRVRLNARNKSDETRDLEVISSSETGAVALALKLVDDLHGKRFYPGEVTFLSKV
jgi:hypothetical protein